MARILKSSDRIKLKIDDVTFSLSPLKYWQKAEIADCYKMVGGVEKVDAVKMIYLYIKYAVKGLDGVEDLDGNPYEIKLEDDVLIDECAEDILNLEITNKMQVAAFQMINSIPKEIVDSNGKKMKGVSIKVESGAKK